MWSSFIIHANPFKVFTSQNGYKNILSLGTKCFIILFAVNRIYEEKVGYKIITVMFVESSRLIIFLDISTIY